MSFENFLKWMELATDLSEKSIKNYLGGISKIDKDLLETSTSRKSLEAISSINELVVVLRRDIFQGYLAKLVVLKKTCCIYNLSP